jgi:4-hydroxybenzoate polyprenyltransferase
MATESLIAGYVLPVMSDLHLLVAGSTLVVYNIPGLVPRSYGEKRELPPFFLWRIGFAALGVLLAGITAIRLPGAMLGYAGILGITAFAYFLPLLPIPQKKRLRDYGILKILVLTTVWTLATTLLPALYINHPLTNYPFEILLRFAFVFALCVLFDLRDMQTDKLRNINTVPNKIGINNSYRLVYGSLLLFILLSVVQYYRFHVPGRLIASVVTTVATVGVAAFARRNPGHGTFVLLTDGMMLLYATLVLLM